MTAPILVDTGPLVAALDRRDHYHVWARETLGRLEGRTLSCEPVLAEACHLVRRLPGGVDRVLGLVLDGHLEVPFRLSEQASAVAALLRRYADLPMSLADACLVRMAEQHTQSAVLTLDSDFTVYRKHGRQVVPTVMPPTH